MKMEEDKYANLTTVTPALSSTFVLSRQVQVSGRSGVTSLQTSIAEGRAGSPRIDGGRKQNNNNNKTMLVVTRFGINWWQKLTATILYPGYGPGYWSSVQPADQWAFH